MKQRSTKKAQRVESSPLRSKRTKPVFWTGNAPFRDDFGQKIVDEFIDGVTKMGPWAIMTPWSWGRYGGSTKLGTGLGQRYKRQPDGMWLKVEG